ncbi:hypothetical protein OQA88_415 [Cercophora sp. LCS_1]
MRLSPVLLAALFGSAAAHGDHGGQHIPKLVGGRRFMEHMRKRQGAMPQENNKKPVGEDTFPVARPKVGSVLYGGAGIYECVKNGDIALTFDDGPYIYTEALLDKLKSYGAKATFFITGNNLGKGQINDPSTIYPAILRRMHAEGHQIASHTWSHQNASQLTNTQFTNQMVWNEIAINSVLGFFPTYMRPPYSICERNCQNILATLGYHAIYFDLDTAGYLNDSPRQIQTSKNIWDQAMRTSDPDRDSFLQIEHDIHDQVVHNLTDYILTSLFSNGFQAVTVAGSVVRINPNNCFPNVSNHAFNNPVPYNKHPRNRGAHDLHSNDRTVSNDGPATYHFKQPRNPKHHLRPPNGDPWPKHRRHLRKRDHLRWHPIRELLLCIWLLRNGFRLLLAE